MNALAQSGVAGVATVLALAAVATGPVTAQETPPETVELTGIVRDFRERTDNGGHPDFERRPPEGYRLYKGLVETFLDENGRPVFTGEGTVMRKSWRDWQGKRICACVASRHPRSGDKSGKAAETGSGGIQSPRSFELWYQDQAGINMSAPLAITFLKREDGAWAFDDELDPAYAELGGFFPIDGQLFGNSGSVEGIPDHNYHFTFELHATFTWTSGTDRFLEIRADDDLWVFINGELVIDLGGVHRAKSQFLDLGRLGLTNGATARLDLFYADRHRKDAKLRIVTNIDDLRPSDTPSEEGPSLGNADATSEE